MLALFLSLLSLLFILLFMLLFILLFLKVRASMFLPSSLTSVWEELFNAKLLQFRVLFCSSPYNQRAVPVGFPLEFPLFNLKSKAVQSHL